MEREGYFLNSGQRSQISEILEQKQHRIAGRSEYQQRERVYKKNIGEYVKLRTYSCLLFFLSG